MGPQEPDWGREVDVSTVRHAEQRAQETKLVLSEEKSWEDWGSAEN